MPRTIIDVATGEATPAPYTETVDNGDGTGTRTTFDADGNVTSVEQLTDLPIPQPPEPSPEEKLAAMTARLDKLAPVRSEHDVPADPTYLPPATDLRTPR